MIIRIVRMHFKAESVDTFVSIFSTNKEAIRNMPGCLHLELLTDKDHPETYTTLSHWQSESDLEAYRVSTLFKQVWTRVKPLFSRKPEAYSLEKLFEL